MSDERKPSGWWYVAAVIAASRRRRDEHVVPGPDTGKIVLQTCIICGVIMFVVVSIFVPIFLYGMSNSRKMIEQQQRNVDDDEKAFRREMDEIHRKAKIARDEEDRRWKAFIAEQEAIRASKK